MADAMAWRIDFPPPPLGLMPPFFILRQLQYLIRRIAQHAIKHAAAGILSIRISSIGQPDHLAAQLNCTPDILIAGSQTGLAPQMGLSPPDGFVIMAKGPLNTFSKQI